MDVLLSLTVPLILGCVGIVSVIKGVSIYPALTDGALDGLKTVRDMFPALLVLFPAVSMLRASGALDALSELLSPFFGLLGIPPETSALAFLRPISGSAATAAGTELISAYGADSLIGRTAAVMLGSSETTFYVISVYFTAANVKNTRWAIPAALCADLAVFLASAWICRVFWG